LLRSIRALLQDQVRLDDKTKEWTDKKGNKCFTYFDLDNMGYRTAVGDYVVTPKGLN
jgi:hypothetical protein